MTNPLVLSLALDAESEDVVRVASALARAMGAPIVPVHALGWAPLEDDIGITTRLAETREKILSYMDLAIDEGATVLEPVLARGRPDDAAIEAAARAGAQMIVTGGGGPATVRRWVLGSVAERIVRASHVPVFVARGITPQTDMPVLCPLDLSPHSRVGLYAAARMARLFGSPIVTLTAIPEEHRGWVSSADLEHAAARDVPAVEAQVRAFVAAMDLSGLSVQHRVIVGDPATRIAEASETAWLMVIASRGFTQLKATALGGVTERAIRLSRSSLFTVRDEGGASAEHEAAIRDLAALKRDAEASLADGAPERALPLLQLAASRAPANAQLQELLAEALDRLGRAEEATARRKLAGNLRDSFA